MIWNFLRKSRLILLSLVGLFSLFFSFSLSTSTYALTDIGANSSFSVYFTEDFVTNPAQGIQSSVKNGTYSLDQVITGYNNGLVYDTAKSWGFYYPRGIKQFVIQMPPIIPTANSATIHLEYNVVLSNQGANITNWVIDALDNLTVYNINANSTYSNVSYAFTDWTRTFQYQTNIIGSNQRTITFYVDVAVSGLTVGQSKTFVLLIGRPDDAPYIRTKTDYWNNTYKFNIFPEKLVGDVDYYNSQSEALQQAQINATNITNNLLLDQYNQDQEDRTNIQNVSDDANTDGSNATTGAQNATSSLLGAITSIYGTLLHPTTSNCNIGPINLYNQLDLGTLDMCTFSIPQPLFAIGALVLIGLVILLAWSVLHATMSLYKDLFGGKG